MELLTSSQRDFLQRLEPPPEPGCSETTLSRRNLWHHDVNHPLRPQERVRLLLSSAAEDFCEWIENSVQEPEAVAWNYLLWQSHEKAAVEDDASSVAPSLSGDLFQERERLAAYLALTPERKASPVWLGFFEHGNHSSGWSRAASRGFSRGLFFLA